jgi:hypothetical protein
MQLGFRTFFGHPAGRTPVHQQGHHIRRRGIGPLNVIEQHRYPQLGSHPPQQRPHPPRNPVALTRGRHWLHTGQPPHLREHCGKLAPLLDLKPPTARAPSPENRRSSASTSNPNVKSRSSSDARPDVTRKPAARNPPRVPTTNRDLPIPGSPRTATIRELPFRSPVGRLPRTLRKPQAKRSAAVKNSPTGWFGLQAALWRISAALRECRSGRAGRRRRPRSCFTRRKRHCGRPCLALSPDRV